LFICSVGKTKTRTRKGKKGGGKETKGGREKEIFGIKNSSKILIDFVWFLFMYF